MLSDVGWLTRLLSGPLGALASRDLRVRPRQARSIGSVERILTTAASMTLRKSGAHPVSLEGVATAAGVTPQAVYRYVKDVDELVRTSLRCLVIREHERLVLRLSRRVLPDEFGMASAIVGIVIESCERLSRFPAPLRDDVLQQYRQIGYDAAPLMADLLCEGAGGDDVRRPLDIVKLAVALTVTTAVATSSFSGRIPSLREGRLEELLVDLFLGVLRSGGNSSDAFREITVDADGRWRGDAG